MNGLAYKRQIQLICRIPGCQIQMNQICQTTYQNAPNSCETC